MKSKGLIGGIAAGVIIITIAIVLICCTSKVPAGYVAVQYSMNGGVKDKILTQGWHIVSPTIKTVNYTIGLEQSYLTADKKGDSSDDESFMASSSEGKAMTLELTYSYQYQAEDVVNVFNKFKGQDGKTVRDSFIKPNIISWTKEVVAGYKIADILGSERANINKALTDYLSEKFKNYGITISNVSLIDISVDEDTEKAINEKIKAQQNAETQNIQNQTNIDKAAADALVKTTKAQANAEALLIEAEAQAEANKKLKESLSDEVLRSNYIEKWDGSLPSVVGGDSTIISMLDNTVNTETKEDKK